MPSKVFISYRRDDSKYQARMIHEAFRRVLPREHVFMDIDSIPPGANFRKILKDWVDECEVLVALVGPGWIDATDPKTRRRRLDNPSDFVRIEIGEALARNIPVVPVLIDGTRLPEVDLLPDELKELVDRQAEFIEYRTFDADVKRLIRKLGLVQRPIKKPRLARRAKSVPPQPAVAPPRVALAEDRMRADGRVMVDAKNIHGARETTQPVIFISYSHLDEPDPHLLPGEDQWLSFVRSHLEPFAAHFKLELWDDRRIDGGANWRAEIDGALDRCAVCVFLVSRHSLSSRFILDVEMKRILERHQAKGAHLFPIVITAVDLGAAPWLSRLNLKPRNGTPLEDYDTARRNTVMSELAAEIRGIIERAATG
jgi:hypothetical protein